MLRVKKTRMDAGLSWGLENTDSRNCDNYGTYIGEAVGELSITQAVTSGKKQYLIGGNPTRKPAPQPS